MNKSVLVMFAAIGLAGSAGAMAGPCDSILNRAYQACRGHKPHTECRNRELQRMRAECAAFQQRSAYNQTALREQRQNCALAKRCNGKARKPRNCPAGEIVLGHPCA